MKQNTFKKALSSLLVVCMLVSMFAVISVNAKNTLTLKADSLLSFGEADGTKYVIGLSENKTVADLLANFESAEITVSKDGNALSEDAIVGTGANLTLGEDTAYVVILGDTDGDGVVSNTDYLQIKSYFHGAYALEGIYLIAADSESNGDVDATDYLQIKSYFLGTFNLYPEIDEETSNDVISEEPSSQPAFSEEPSSNPESSEEASSENPSEEVVVEFPYKEKIPYYFAFDSATLGNTYYFTGKMSGLYLATSTDFTLATDVYVEKVESGCYLYFITESTKTYLNIVERTDAAGKVILKLEETPSNVYTFDSTLNILVSNVAGADYWLGTYNSYDTIAASKTTYILGDNASQVGVSQFPTYLVALKSSDENSSEEPSSNPESSEESSSENPSEEVVEFPYKEGTPYKFLANTYYLCLKNIKNTIYYFYSSTDLTLAIDVYVEKVEGGYYLYCFSGGEKIYITITPTYNSEEVLLLTNKLIPSNVYTFDPTLKILISSVEGIEYWLGISNSSEIMKPYNISCITGDNASDLGVYYFPAKLVTNK